jgi:GT2 family glycosyltransferase
MKRAASALCPPWDSTWDVLRPTEIPWFGRILLGSPLPDGLGECATCSQMARLETYRQLGGFDSSLRRTEDTDFNIRLAQAGGHFVGLAQPLVDQYMTKTFDKSLADEHHYNIILLAKHKNLLKNPAQYEFLLRLD